MKNYSHALFYPKIQALEAPNTLLIYKNMYKIENIIASIPINEYIKEYQNTDKFLVFCQQCDKYNNSWTCPPLAFDTETYLQQGKYLYVIGTKISPTPQLLIKCCTVEDTRRIAREVIAEVRKYLDEKLLELETKHKNTIAFYAGSCHLCKENTCTRKMNLPCLHSTKIRYSLEAFGFDLGKTTTNLLDIDLQWSEDGNFPKYLTLISGLLSQYPIKIENIEVHMKKGAIK